MDGTDKNIWIVFVTFVLPSHTVKRERKRIRKKKKKRYTVRNIGARKLKKNKSYKQTNHKKVNKQTKEHTSMRTNKHSI